MKKNNVKGILPSWLACGILFSVLTWAFIVVN